ncbi:hypothetical protein [Planktothricoides sp. SR001]|uniref:hypothetical protein n=1 Tax=Planktothricoides sp. SR001 TaxID=1705388 RepID=UPI0018D05053|nr:hypothetical protein [Planktothricoides sp. SR001]
MFYNTTFTQSNQLTNALDPLIFQADQIQSVQEMTASRAIAQLRWIIVGGTFIFGIVAIGLSTWLTRSDFWQNYRVNEYHGGLSESDCHYRRTTRTHHRGSIQFGE